MICAELGFTRRFFRFAGGDMQAMALPPPWVSLLRCDKDDTSLDACLRAAFGDTAACGVLMALFCSNAPASAPRPVTCM